MDRIRVAVFVILTLLVASCTAPATPIPTTIIISATPSITPPAVLFWPLDGGSDPGEDDLFGAFRTADRNHSGLDIDAPVGTEIYAAKAGVVELAEWVEGYGWLIVINHKDGTETYYAHMRYEHPFAVEVSQAVSRGQLIGFVGDTGWSTAPHLHFEYRVDGIAIDPFPLLYPRKLSVQK
jgi:murein DD-endopeptidase MepM/ murein hydrolase activator NlpD